MVVEPHFTERAIRDSRPVDRTAVALEGCTIGDPAGDFTLVVAVAGTTGAGTTETGEAGTEAAEAWGFGVDGVGLLAAGGGVVGEAVGVGNVATSMAGAIVAISTGSVGTEGSSSIVLGDDPPFPEFVPLPPETPPPEALLPPEPPEPELVEPLFDAAAGSVVVVPKQTTSMSATKAPANP
jgi:hypothetical protein